jgi:hypothetical protein
MCIRSAIDCHLSGIASLVLQYIKEEKQNHPDGWIPAATIKQGLGLNLLGVPQNNPNGKPSGWLFGIIARRLEDGELIEYKSGKRAYCKSK